MAERLLGLLCGEVAREEGFEPGKGCVLTESREERSMLAEARRTARATFCFEKAAL